MVFHTAELNGYSQRHYINTIKCLTRKKQYESNTEPLTHAYAHLLVDMHLAVFAPAFTFSLCESECSRKPQDAHSLGR